MELKVYKLKVTSDLYIQKYDIRATDLKDASKKAKVKFAKSYHQFGDKVKVSLRTEDVANHIEEIMHTIYEGGG